MYIHRKWRASANFWHFRSAPEKSKETTERIITSLARVSFYDLSLVRPVFPGGRATSWSRRPRSSPADDGQRPENTRDCRRRVLAYDGAIDRSQWVFDDPQTHIFSRPLRAIALTKPSIVIIVQNFQGNIKFSNS